MGIILLVILVLLLLGALPSLAAPPELGILSECRAGNGPGRRFDFGAGRPYLASRAAPVAQGVRRFAWVALRSTKGGVHARITSSGRRTA